MKLLISQIEFEQLIGLQDPDPGTVLPEFTVIYFTASWCGACRALDLPALESALPRANWLKCDVDVNNYTMGYCNIRAVPSFIIVHKKKIVDTFTSNNTQKVIEWASAHALLAWSTDAAGSDTAGK
jgi:thioredoxin-like negative regulator of GroEL